MVSDLNMPARAQSKGTFIMTTKYKNTLVWYDGGGYSGCICEPNFAFFDDSGKHHTIYKSGCDGRDEEGVRTLIAQPENFPSVGYCRLYTMDQAGFDKFVEDMAGGPSRVVGVWKALGNLAAEGFIEAAPDLLCRMCGEPCCEEPELYGPHGIGGLAVEYDGWACDECRAGNTCEICGEWVGEENLAYSEVEGYGEVSACEFCREPTKCDGCDKALDNRDLVTVRLTQDQPGFPEDKNYAGAILELCAECRAKVQEA